MVTSLDIVSQFLARTIVAFSLGCLVYPFIWWASVIVFPVVMVAGGLLFRPRWRVQARYLIETRSLDVIKSLFARMIILYVFGSAVMFQWNLGRWYGWLAGGTVAAVGSYVMAWGQRRWLGLGGRRTSAR